MTEIQLKEQLEKLYKNKRFAVKRNNDKTFMVYEYDEHGNEIVYPRVELRVIRQNKYTIYDLDSGASVLRFGVKNV